MEVHADGEHAAMEVVFILLEDQEATPPSPDAVGIARIWTKPDLVDPP